MTLDIQNRQHCLEMSHLRCEFHLQLILNLVVQILKDDLKASFKSDLKGIIFVILVQEQVVLISSSDSVKPLLLYVHEHFTIM